MVVSSPQVPQVPQDPPASPRGGDDPVRPRDGDVDPHDLLPRVPPVAAAHLSPAQARAVLARARELYERSEGVTRERVRAAEDVRTSYARFRSEAPDVSGAEGRGPRLRVDLDPDDEDSTALLRAIHRHQDVERATVQVAEPAERLARDLPAALSSAGAAGSRARMLWRPQARRSLVHAALVELERWTAWADTTRLWRRLDEAATALARPGPRSEEVWRDFQHNAPAYYEVLERVVALRRDPEASEGFLPSAVAERVRCQELDERLLRVRLRGYQAFGARFALAQRRVILGDEMGLGKTVQSVAALCHVAARGGTHALVVAPASVLVNWTREVTARSALTAYRLHGAGRDAAVRDWSDGGGVGVTTFEALQHLLPCLEAVDLAMLVVDEAHYVKNPATRRSRAVAAVCAASERVLFLTGTPMENRAEEFTRLVEHLQPELGPLLETGDAVVRPTAFRQAVAPVYLRRNQEDVLGELPDLVQVEEWEEFGRADLAAYREAVAAGNFMAMRRAGFASGDPRSSAKLGRLVEIVSEARENGRKVVVFSYFRDVLTTVLRVLGKGTVGPLTGDIPATERQAMVDGFSAVEGHAVLVSQILAGGVGLNMQSASVVILCEPQVKPTMETQAVARAHRMGQVRTVQVHRLLLADSVDERMLEILETKSRLFDDYARRSDLAESSPEALDLSAAELARQIVALERQRLAPQDGRQAGA